jgi:CheY-like chemotaxis protein
MCNFLQSCLARRGSAIAIGGLAMSLPFSDSILVVDDDVDNREMLVEYLQLRGFTVRAAPNGATALPIALSLRPRVILMDLAMPELDGLETTRRLRANASLRDTTIIAVTTRTLATDREAAHHAGCNFFVPKPLDLTTLANLVDGLLHPSATRPATAPRLSPKSDL